jgi:hypothetical protein
VVYSVKDSTPRRIALHGGDFYADKMFKFKMAVYTHCVMNISTTRAIHSGYAIIDLTVAVSGHLVYQSYRGFCTPESCQVHMAGSVSTHQDVTDRLPRQHSGTCLWTTMIRLMQRA